MHPHFETVNESTNLNIIGSSTICIHSNPFNYTLPSLISLPVNWLCIWRGYKSKAVFCLCSVGCTHTNANTHTHTHGGRENSANPIRSELLQGIGPLSDNQLRMAPNGFTTMYYLAPSYSHYPPQFLPEIIQTKTVSFGQLELWRRKTKNLGVYQ